MFGMTTSLLTVLRIGFHCIRVPLETSAHCTFSRNTSPHGASQRNATSNITSLLRKTTCRIQSVYHIILQSVWLCRAHRSYWDLPRYTVCSTGCEWRHDSFWSRSFPAEVPTTSSWQSEEKRAMAAVSQGEDWMRIVSSIAIEGGTGTPGPQVT